VEQSAGAELHAVDREEGAPPHPRRAFEARGGLLDLPGGCSTESSVESTISVSGSPTSSATTPRRKGSRRKHREACGGGGATRRARGRPPRRTGDRRSGRRRAGGRSSVRSLHAPELLNTKARVITSRSPRGAFKRLVSPRSARIEPGVGVVDQAEEHDLTASSVVARRGVWWWQAIRCSFVGEQQSDGPFLTHRSTQQTSM
jgi:hypothetical protein